MEDYFNFLILLSIRIAINERMHRHLIYRGVRSSIRINVISIKYLIHSRCTLQPQCPNHYIDVVQFSEVAQRPALGPTQSPGYRGLCPRGKAADV